jgi:hypothetical protein
MRKLMELLFFRELTNRLENPPDKTKLYEYRKLGESVGTEHK